MSKDNITDYSTTAVSNTDVGGVGITNSDSAENLRDAMQELMAAEARMNSGAAPLNDTFKLRNATDTTKTVSWDLSGLSTGEAAQINVARKGSPIETIYTASGTHTFNTKSRYFQVIGVGGGAGGGGVDGQGTSKLAAASGGGSGFFGRSAVLAKGSIATGTIVIGTAGTGGAGAGGNDGTNGGDTTWSDGTNSFTWGGGKAGKGVTADTGTYGLAAYPTRATATGTLYGSANFSTSGFITSASGVSSAPGVAKGGAGACSQFGTGGGGTSGSAATDANGYGAGGGGAGVSEVTTNYSGGNGTAGLLIVLEW